jgi:hypothetical protein
MGKKQQLDIGRRGSPSWAFNRLREDALAQLLNDLYSVEDQGLTPEQCKLVADAIAKVVNYATAIPDGSFFVAAHLGNSPEVRECLPQLERAEGSYPTSNSTPPEPLFPAPKDQAQDR